MWYNRGMNDKDMDFEQFAQEVTSQTPFEFTDSLLYELFEDGYTVFDAVDWAEWKLDTDLFGDC